MPIFIVEWILYRVYQGVATLGFWL